MRVSTVRRHGVPLPSSKICIIGRRTLALRHDVEFLIEWTCSIEAQRNKMRHFFNHCTKDFLEFKFAASLPQRSRLFILLIDIS